MPPKGLRKSRRAEAASVRFQNVTKEGLQSDANILSVAESKSSMRNKDLARRVLAQFCVQTGFKDPVSVSKESSNMILNLLTHYCKTKSDNPLSVDLMGAIIQGLRAVYTDYGHRGAWFVDRNTGLATGNPLTGNEDLKILRSKHRKQLSKLGRLKTRPTPLSMAHVCEHAERFWFTDSKVDYRDALLHAIMLVGLNLGMRYDEIQKVEIGHVTVNPGVTDTGSIRFTIMCKIKNSVEPREFFLRKWPGNTKMRNSFICCPFSALLTWISIRGNRPGYLFSYVTEKKMIRTEQAWPVQEFVKFLRQRLQLCGVGKDDALMYSGHSIKKGSVQLWRYLGLTKHSKSCKACRNCVGRT